MIHKQTGIRRLVNTMSYSLAGLKAAWKHEAAFRQEIIALLVLVPLGLWIGQNDVERAFLLLSSVIVIVTELLNSAIEAVVDRVGTDYHHLSERAKDLGSAAVFVSIILMVVIWMLILL